MAGSSLVETLLEQTNYFVCTLGQAALINAIHPRPQLSVNEFIDEQAARIPDLPAVGFALPSRGGARDESWSYRALTFQDLQQGSKLVARELSRTVLPPPPVDDYRGLSWFRSRTVALLFPSSPDFLFLWLALTRLGFATLQIAPQCPPAAIAHLLQTCDVSVLVYDAAYRDLVTQAAAAHESMRDAEGPELVTALSPFAVLNLTSLQWIDSVIAEPTDIAPYWPVDDADVNFVQHTSGTSGMPKPITQSHRDSVGVLPYLPRGREAATFTTTPLYHGGMVDMFRAWTSDAMIWLIAGHDLPITAVNVIKSLKMADTAAENGSRPKIPRVRYFASVPFVLQMLVADEEGLEILKRMDIVGVGGAPLSAAIGDDMVSKGVRLISRFGSTESGFLLCSHREYEKDREWQYLRAQYGCEHLRFEPQGDGLSELVVLPGWPRIAKVNRPDGSYATSDLFEPHASIPHAWKYHSRADSQLTLVTAKKFDPAPIESRLSSLPMIAEAYVFGRNQPYPGVFLFPSEAVSHMSPDDFIESLWPQVEKINANNPAHARLSRRMLLWGRREDLPLEKSSKGTLLRGQIEKRFDEQISKAYGDANIQNGNGNGVEAPISDGTVPGRVFEIVRSVLDRARDIDEDVDLFLQGVDSVAAMQIRSSLQKLLPPKLPALPLNIVYDCGTIKKLAEYIVKLRKGETYELQDDTRQMLELVEQFGKFEDDHGNVRSNAECTERNGLTPGREVVILTGATGALGAHVLGLLRTMTSVSKIFCLVRASDSVAAAQRVHQSLVQRGKQGLSTPDQKVECIVSKFGEPDLGLSPDLYRSMASTATIIIHSAWAVNFSMRLGSFVKDHIAGLHNLISFALSSKRRSPPAFLFCSSVASVLGPAGFSIVPECPSYDPATASPLGYAKSKWVGEAICQRAHETTALHGRMHVLRIGQLCGDTRGGIWNVTEAWPLMLSSVGVTGALPDLDEPLSWLPVDIAAKAVLQIAQNAGSSSGSSDKKTEDVPVYHILNPDKSTRWSDLLKWMKDPHSSSQASQQPTPLSGPFDVISPRDWIAQLENLDGEAGKHPARKLLGLWKDAYAPSDLTNPTTPRKTKAVTFDMTLTKVMAPAMATDVKPIDRHHFELLYRWIQREMIFPSSATATGRTT